MYNPEIDSTETSLYTDADVYFPETSLNPTEDKIVHNHDDCESSTKENGTLR
jgi:hypothetical protein